MPLAKLFRPPTIMSGSSCFPHDIASEAPSAMKLACANPDSMAYDVDLRHASALASKTFSDEGQFVTSTFPSSSSSTALTKQPGLPLRIFRTLRSNISRVGGKRKASERSFPDGFKEKKMAYRQDPLDEQVDIAKRVSYYLTDAYSGTAKPDPLFIGEREPPISFSSYVQRLIELTNKWVEEPDGSDSFGVRCALLAVEYLERVEVRLDGRSIHRYFMTAFLIAIKMLYDYYISNSFWAEVSGCPRKQVNLMESQLCRILGWDFTVDAEKHAKFIWRFVR